MKIMWMSDGPGSPTGLGNVTRFVCAGLAAFGHDVAIIGGPEGGKPRRLKRYTVYPETDFAGDGVALKAALRRLRPDVLITLYDPWRVRHLTAAAPQRYLHDSGIPWLHYCPIDNDMGGGRLSENVTSVLKKVDLPIAMSRYGLKAMQTSGLTPAYIPHGVDTALFCPPASKQVAKRQLAYGKRFVILSDARNQIRKLWPTTLEIFRRFAANKNDVLLHLHCDPYDYAANTPEYCYDLLADISFLRLTTKVRFTRGFTAARGISLKRLAALYQAADVHLLSSFGEGFGIPTLQAAAAGVVPLAAAFSASKELAQGHGEAIRVRHYVRLQSEMRYALIDIDDAVRRLDRLYHDRSLLRAKSDAARCFAESYDWDQIVRQWHELLEREVPRRRHKTGIGGRAISLASAAQGARRGDRELPDALKVKVESKGKGETITASSLPGRTRSGSKFSIPVTLPSACPAIARLRVTGRVYLASAADVPVFRQLHRIFPGLSAWSTAALLLRVRSTDGRDLQCATFSACSPEFPAQLAASTLALDVAASESALAQQAAELGVPLVGLRSHENQSHLWPDLTLATRDAVKAAEKGRWMLTDHGAASAACTLARKRARRNGLKRRRQ